MGSEMCIRDRNNGMDLLTGLARKFLTNEKDHIEKNSLKENIDGDVNVVNFLPFLMDEYFHYHGSLTTGQ